MENVSYEGGSVIFWAGINLESRTELFLVERVTVNARSYITDILVPHVIPYAGFVSNRLMLMHDNARAYVAICVRQYLQEVKIPFMEELACSLDLYPIEHL